AISEADALAERSEERAWCAELHRLRGVLLAAMCADRTQVEAAFSTAIATAKRQKSVSLEKRAEATYAEYHRQKANAMSCRRFSMACCSYVQAYRAGAWPPAHLKHLCADAQMIDTFIGESDMLGQGHGSAYLRELAQMLIDEGSPAVAIDPAAKNERARRAYTRAGFEGDDRKCRRRVSSRYGLSISTTLQLRRDG